MLDRYLAELRKVQMVTPEEEQTLWRAYKEAGEQAARHRLIECYQPLVFKIALHYRTAEPLFMDIIQEGTVGLIEAVENYDHTKGVAFSLYAQHRIRGRIVNMLVREGRQELLSIDAPLDYVTSVTLADQLVDTRADTAGHVERRYLTSQVKSALARLPLNEQAVLSGVYVEERTPKDLAADMNLSVSHIYRLQKQGLRRVRGMLAKLMHDFKLG